jgi:hypothetical protein
MAEADYVIAYPGDRPPFLCPRPSDYRGQLWRYVEATPQAAAEALEVCDREFPDQQPDEELVALARLLAVPTRADHERAARDELAVLSQTYPWARSAEQAYIAYRVAERAHERHEARARYARRACRAAINRLWPDEDVARTIPEAAIAILSLHGQGGPDDLGGEEGASALPLLRAPVFRFRARSGPAWCAALSDVARGWELIIDGRAPAILVENKEHGESCLLWSPDITLHQEVRAVLRRVILRLAEDVLGRRARVTWRGWPDDYDDAELLRTALALLVCPPVAHGQVAAATKEDRDGE